ncbi:MAG: GerMN domain-containing protein, partial [Chloroflexota bacterium]
MRCILGVIGGHCGATYKGERLRFKVGVKRWVPADADLPEAVLREFFRGPTPDEQALGLQAVTSGFTGFSRLEIEDGVARLYLGGTCSSLGATYTVAQPILANLLQFPEVDWVKIY